jgi:serine protease Do
MTTCRRDFRYLLIIFAVILGTAIVEPRSSVAQYETVSAHVAPATVYIQVSKPGIGETTGTGFFIDPDGYLLTARHIIEGAGAIQVRTTQGLLTATIIDYGATADAALLKVDGSGFPTVSLGDSDTVRQGQEILVFGTLLGRPSAWHPLPLHAASSVRCGTSRA